MHSPPRSILLIADPILPVPPPLYGGIERVVHFLAEGLAARGSKVTLVCHPASTCQVSKIPFAEHDIDRKSRFKNLRMLIRHLLQERYDVVHSFSHVDMALPLWPFRQPVIQSFQAMPNWAAFSRRVRYIPKQNLYFTTCGHHMVEKFEGIAPTCGIHNGIILDQFDYRSQVAPDAPLVFLGRIEPIKGTHHAIQIARESGRKLIIAGNRSSDPKLDRYFIEQVQPQLDDQIRFIGPVNDVQKNELLGQAAAFLMPIEWDEPFGIVMAEALACGTPVIGTARGALPEIVTDGVTGLGCKDVGGMIDAVKNVDSFSREACRKSAEQRFSSEIIVDRYIAFYDEILGH